MQSGKLLRVNLEQPQFEVVTEVARVLRKGGVAVLPTDTIYGLSCLASDEQAVERIVQIKGRESSKGLLVLIANLSWLKRVTLESSPHKLKLLARIWPGPVTVLLRAARNVSSAVGGEAGKIGVRQPRLPFLEQLLERVGEPLVSTSANLSGHPYSGDLAQLEKLFLARVDIFVEAEQESPGKVVASTVLDWSGTKPSIVREGTQVQQLFRLLEI